MVSEIKPELVEKYILFATQRYAINVDVVENNGAFIYEQVQIPAGRWDYAGVVDALVQYKYPIDKMQAVINNYLLDPEDAYAIDEFNKMQEWRKEAKEIAKEVLTYGVS